MKKRINPWVIVTGVVIGIAAVALALLGNPKNMGFCIACFLRDIAGATKLHSATAVQYVRPEIIGLILGAFIMALASKEFKAKAGSSPATRFILGAIVMIGALAFLGCPLRMVIRMGSGDLNAFVGFLGFALGIGIGIIFLKNGFSLKRNYESTLTEGLAMPGLAMLLLILFLAVPTIFSFTEAGGGPGAKVAPVAASLLIALLVGALAQKSRICMVGGMRDATMFKDFNLLIGFGCIFVIVLLGNLIFAQQLGFKGFSFAPYGNIAHSDFVGNLFGMMLVGWGSTLLGGCPLRQLILAGEGNGDSAVTVLGMVVGAAISHNFGLAGAGASKSVDEATGEEIVKNGGVSDAGKIAIFLGLAILLIISLVNTFVKKKEAKT